MNKILQTMALVALCTGSVCLGAEPEAPAQPVKRPSFSFAKTVPPAMNPQDYENPAKVKELLEKRVQTLKKLRASYGSVVKKNRRAKEIEAEMKKLMDELVNIVEHDSDVMMVNDELKQIDNELQRMPLKKVEPAKETASPAAAPQK